VQLSSRFRDLRVRAGLTQTALAKPRYTVSFVSQIESGRRSPSGEAMEFFAGRLGVSSRYLATGVPDQLEDTLRFRLEEALVAIRKGTPEEGVAIAEAVAEEAGAHALSRVRARALGVQGEALAVAGKLREALDRLEEALEGDLAEPDAADAVSRLARTYRDLGDLAYAEELVTKFLDRRDRPPLDPGVAADLQGVLLSIYYERGDMTRAERAAERALAAAEQAADLEARANTAWDAARVLAESRQWDQALEMATRARVLLEELDERRNVGQLHLNTAFICLEADPPRTEEAALHLEVAELRLRVFGSQADLAFVWSERGRLALLEGRHDDALREVDRALPAFGEMHGEVARCMYLRGRALACLGRMEEARQALERAAEAFGGEGARQQQASCYRELGEIDLAAGDVDAAVRALRAGLNALDPRRSRA
jgi:tetratricopeptide (TPR) repeat protein